MAPYWQEFASYSPYQVEIAGTFTSVVLKSRSGDRIVGATVENKAGGVLLLLPPLEYDEDEFVRHDEKKQKSYWTPAALKFSKKLASTLSSLFEAIRESTKCTPPPDWVSEPQYQMARERDLEQEISAITKEISSLNEKKALFNQDLNNSGTLRRLLYETGKPLEAAVLEALKLLGFDAQPFNDDDSEFDAVFVGKEGRFLGEAEGKDKKPVNIDKLRQLVQNLHEDYAKEGVSEVAKGVLFGNAFRLLPASSREQFFTEKCLTVAKLEKIALVCTPDLFNAAKYLSEHPEDEDYARLCREAMFRAEGEVVVFPPCAIMESAPGATVCLPSSKNEH